MLNSPAVLPKKLLLNPSVVNLPALDPAKKLLLPKAIEDPVDTLPILILLPVNPRTPLTSSFVWGFVVPIPIL